MATKIDRVGKTRMMNCGMKATIIRYENADDINICFEDGKVVEHKTYRAFKKGYIAHQNTNVPVEARLDETQMMNCGMEATIIRYENSRDIDVRFEDGKVVGHKAYGTFKKVKSLMSHSVKNAVPKTSTALSANRDLKMKIEFFTNASVSIVV